MRLSEIRDILIRTIPKLGNLSTQGNEHHTRVSGILSTIGAVKALASVQALRSVTKEILDINYLAHSAVDELVADTPGVRAFQRSLSKLTSRAQSLLDALNEHLGTEAADSTFIRLPEKVSLDQFGKYLIKLDKFLKLIVVNELVPNGKVELRGVESGSVWVEVGLGAAGLLMLGKVLNYYFAIQEARLKIEAKKLEISLLQVDLQAKQVLFQAYDKMLDEQVRERFSDLVGETEPETSRRIEVGIKGLATLLKSGLQFYSSRNSPAPVSHLFETDLSKLLPTSPGLLNGSTSTISDEAVGEN